MILTLKFNGKVNTFYWDFYGIFVIFKRHYTFTVTICIETSYFDKEEVAGIGADKPKLGLGVYRKINPLLTVL